MKYPGKSIKEFIFHLISLIAVCLSLFFIFISYFNSSIVFLAQAENYGDIKLEFIDQDSVVETHHFLVNPDHMLYTHKFMDVSPGTKLRFYLDGRHRTFASKGVLVIDEKLNMQWISPQMLAERAVHNNITKSYHTGYTALFQGFGRSAYFELELPNPGMMSKVLPYLLVSIFALCLLVAAGMINKLIFSIAHLNQHKIRLFIVVFLLIIFLTKYTFVKFALILFLLYLLCSYYLAYAPDQQKNYRSLIPGIFLLIIFTGFASQEKLLKKMNSELQQQPINFGLFEYIGKRFSEFFVYKKEIGHLNSLLKVDYFGRSPTTKIIVGKQGTMFEGKGERRVEGDEIAYFDNISDFLGRLPFNPEELKQWETVISQRKCWLQQRDIKYLFAIAPTKAMVYPELLPQVLTDIKSKDNRKSRIQQLDDYLESNSDLPVLNLTEPLLEAKKDHQNPGLFYRTDFHWNYLGAYYAYKAIIDRLAALYPDVNISSIALNKFDFEIDRQWAHARFLGMLGLLPKWYNNEHYIKLVPNSDNPIGHIEPYKSDAVYDIPIPAQMITASNGQEFAVEHLQNPNGKIKSIMVIGDSFIQKVFPLISGHAKNNYFSRAVFHFPHQLIETLKPDIVIQEILNMYLLRQPPTNPAAIQNSTCSE